MSLKDFLAWELDHIERMQHVDRFMDAVYEVDPGVFYDLAETVYSRFCGLEAQGLWMRGYYALSRSLETFSEVQPYHDALTAWQERHYLVGDGVASYVWNVQGSWSREPERFGQPVSFMELFSIEPLRQKKGRTPGLERLTELVHERYGGQPEDSDSLIDRMARNLYQSGKLERSLEGLGLDSGDLKAFGAMNLHRGRNDLDKARKDQHSHYLWLAQHQCLRLSIVQIMELLEETPHDGDRDFDNVQMNVRRTAERVGIVYRLRGR